MNPKANHGLFAAIQSATKGEPLNEGLRLLKTYDHESGAKAKVYKDSDWNEHRVKFFNSKGDHLQDADYHTDDAQDAHDTAQHQLKNLKESDSGERLAHGFIAMHIAAHHAIDTLHKQGIISGQQALNMKAHPTVQQHLTDAKGFKSELTGDDYVHAANYAKQSHDNNVDHKYSNPDSMYFTNIAAK